MAYAPNYYNYQVAVIFAIMIGGMLLLAGVVGAIYFICVVNMRKKKGFQRAPSFGKQRLVGGGGATWPPPQQVYEQQQQQQPQYGMMPSPAPAQNGGRFGQQQQQQQRSQPSPYSQAAAMSYGYQPQQRAPYIPQQQQQHQHQQQQQQQQYVLQQQQHEGPRIRDIQPEYTYQQGPITWTTVTPVVGQYSQQPLQPQIVGGGGGEPAGYHMSSV